MIKLFSDSPCVNWTLPVVKHPRKTPESRAGSPKLTAEQPSLQSQSRGRLPMVCPISQVILPFPSRATHTQTDTRVHVHPKPAAGMGSNMSCFTKLFQSCYARVQRSQRCMMGKTRQETKRQTNQLVPFPFRHTWWFELGNSQRKAAAVT